MYLSEVKVKKLLIAGNYYSTKETRAVSDLQRQGFSIEEISNELGISTSKVRTLMSYKYGRLYGIGANSAQRNKAYRERKHPMRTIVMNKIWIASVQKEVYNLRMRTTYFKRLAN